MSQHDAGKIGPGYTISFRLPVETPAPVIAYLNREKTRVPRGKFSSLCAAPLFISGVLQEIDKTARLSVQLPGELSPEQLEWANTKLVQKNLGQLVYSYITGGGNVTVPLNSEAVQDKTNDEKQDEADNFKLPRFKVNSYHRKIAFSQFEQDD